MISRRVRLKKILISVLLQKLFLAGEDKFEIFKKSNIIVTPLVKKNGSSMLACFDSKLSSISSKTTQLLPHFSNGCI